MTALLDPAVSEVDARPRVLLVDGRPDRRGIMRMVLEVGQAATVVAEAASSAEAVAAAGCCDVDAIVLEVQMPVAIGLEAIAELRGLLPSLTIVVCSFHADPLPRRQAASAGANAYLAKPASPIELRRACRIPVPGGPESTPIPMGLAHRSSPGPAQRDGAGSRAGVTGPGPVLVGSPAPTTTVSPPRRRRGPWRARSDQQRLPSATPARGRRGLPCGPQDGRA